MAKKGLDMMIAVAPHKGGAAGHGLSAPGPLDGNPPAAGDEDESQPDGDESGISQEEVDYSENDLCGSCAHNQDGNCAKYGFPVSETGHCEAGYEAKGGEGGGDMNEEAGEGEPPMGGGSPYGR